MIKSVRTYPNTRPSAAGLKKAADHFTGLRKSEIISSIYTIQHKSLEGFLKNFSAGEDIESECFIRLKNGSSLCVKYFSGHTEVVTYLKNGAEAARLHQILFPDK